MLITRDWHDSTYNGSFVKFIHFVRDPYDLILSAYLYHSQDPPDHREDFLKRRRYHPCESDNDGLERFAFAIAKYIGKTNNESHALLEDVRYVW